MQRSTVRILTTPTGSLPRPAALVQMVEGHDQREVRTHPDFTSQVQAAVVEVVRKQADVGIDVLSNIDGLSLYHSIRWRLSFLALDYRSWNRLEYAANGYQGGGMSRAVTRHV